MQPTDPYKIVLQITRGNVCAGIIVRKGRVVKTAPVYHKMLGAKLESILRAVKMNGWKVETVNEPN